jgi:hypothetical protein
LSSASDTINRSLLGRLIMWRFHRSELRTSFFGGGGGGALFAFREYLTRLYGRRNFYDRLLQDNFSLRNWWCFKT